MTRLEIQDKVYNGVGQTVRDRVRGQVSGRANEDQMNHGWKVSVPLHEVFRESVCLQLGNYLWAGR